MKYLMRNLLGGSGKNAPAETGKIKTVYTIYHPINSDGGYSWSVIYKIDKENGKVMVMNQAASYQDENIKYQDAYSHVAKITFLSKGYDAINKVDHEINSTYNLNNTDGTGRELNPYILLF